MSYSMGHQGKMSLDGVDMTYVSETLALKENHVEPVGIAGTRGKASENVRTGLRIVQGQIVIEPSPLWMGTILKLAMGAFAAPTATLEETLPTFTAIIDRGYKVFTYASAKVNKLEIRASKGQPMLATLDIVAPDESVGASGSYGAYAPNTQAPLMLHDCAATLAGNASQVVDDVIITIDNKLITDRYFNSQTLTAIPEGMREIALGLTVPFDATHYHLYRPTVAGIAAVLAFTNGTISATFTFAKWQIPSESPTTPGRDSEILLKVQGPVRKNGSTLELIGTIDSTV